MKSKILIFKGNYKNRKLQFLIITFSIMLGIILLSVSLGILKSINEPFDKVFNKLNASHILLYYNNQNDDYIKIKDWFSKQSEVESVGEPTPYVSFDGPLMHKGKKVERMVQIAELTANHLIQDKLMVLQGTQDFHPGYGEIWIPKHLAQSNDIHIGDSLGIRVSSGLYNLKVTAFIVDPHFISGLMNPTRVWIAPGSLSLFNPIQNLHNNFMGVRLKKVSDITAVWQRFNNENIYSGSNLQYYLFKSTFLSIYQIISAILIVFSVISIVIALFIVNTTTSSQIYSDYKLIGIYKAIGFTPSDITAVYTIQFIFLTLLAVPTGLLISHELIRLIISSILRSIGLSYNGMQLFVPFAISAIAVFLLVLIISLLSGRDAGKVRAAQAIRYGIPVKEINHRNQSGKLFNSGISLPLIIGFRFISNNIRRSVVSLICIVFTVFIVEFSINVTHSFSDLKNNRSAWGFDNGDVYVSLKHGLKYSRFMESLGDIKEIRGTNPFSYLTISVLSNGKAVQDIFGKIYSGNLDNCGLLNIEGSHPQKSDEISLCSGTARLYNKKAGDSINLRIDGETKKLKITGIYQDVSNLGQGFRMNEPVIKEIDPLYEPDNFSLKLNPGVNIENFKQFLSAKYGSTINIELPVEEQQAFKSIMANVRTSLFLIAAFFIIILVITIWNDLIINIRDYFKTFGIYKTLGFTPFQLRSTLVWRILILVCVGLIIGIPVSIIVSPTLMSSISAGIGLQIFPFETSIWGTMLIVPVILFSAALSSWLISARSAKINSRILLAE